MRPVGELVIVVACIAAMLGGAALAWRWRRYELRGPPGEPGAVRRTLWWTAVFVATVAVPGLLVAGAGGRLAMRLLAITAGAVAQGKVTEADQVVGRITLGGTIGFMIFGGLFGGFVAALVYFGIRRWLPSALGGAASALAIVLLVAVATRADPLRADNPDFGLVGPGWLAVLVFVALIALHSFVVITVAARVSNALPLIEWRPAAVLSYVPVALLLLPGPFIAGVVLVVLTATVLVQTVPAVRNAWASRAVLVGGRVVLAVGVLGALPSAGGAVIDILRR